MPNKYAEYNKRWKSANKERELHNCKRWFEENKDHRRAYKRALYQEQKNNPSFKLKKTLRTRFSKVISGRSKVKSVLRYIGCSAEELKQHLESKFTHEMTWDNHGSLWHVDHIVPLCRFDHAKEEEVQKAWHYTNLQPLLAVDNLKKGAK